jgi:hypothetical protein
LKNTGTYSRGTNLPSDAPSPCGVGAILRILIEFMHSDLDLEIRKSWRRREEEDSRQRIS